MINLDLALMITVAVIFLFMLSALNKMLFKPMLRHMDAREKSLKENQANASQSSGDASELAVEAMKILDDAKHEAHKYLEEEMDKQKEENSKLLNNRKAEIEEEIQAFHKELEVEKEKAQQVLANDAADLTAAIKSKFAV